MLDITLKFRSLSQLRVNNGSNHSLCESTPKLKNARKANDPNSEDASKVA
jgi:hypothetical protein